MRMLFDKPVNVTRQLVKSNLFKKNATTNISYKNEPYGEQSDYIESTKKVFNYKMAASPRDSVESSPISEQTVDKPSVLEQYLKEARQMEGVTDYKTENLKHIAIVKKPPQEHSNFSD